MKLPYIFLSLVALFLASCESATTTTPATLGSITGTVFDTSMNRVSAAKITTDPPTSQIFSDATGRFSIDNVLAGVYLITADKGDEAGTASVRVLPGKTSSADIIISPFGINTGFIRGVVFSTDKIIEPDVTIRTIPATDTTVTGSDGMFYLPNIEAGQYKIIAEKEGIGYATQNATVIAGRSTFLEFVLNEADDFSFESLVAHYPLDGDGKDLSGNNLDLTLENASFATSRFGISATALLGNGESTKGSVPHQDIFNMSAMSISVWIKAPPLTEESMAVASHYINKSSNGFSLYFHKDGFEWFYGDGTNYTFCLITGQQITDDQWHLLTATVDASGSKLYVDGTLVKTGSWTGTPGVPTQICPFLVAQILRTPDDIRSVLNGAVDDIRIYSKVLSASEIQLLWEDR